MVIDSIRSPLRFQGLAREAIHKLKYQNIRVLSDPLASIMAQYIERHPVPVDVLVPVPMHRRRLKERGYNQSDLLASHLGLRLGLPMIANTLQRARHTTPLARTTSVLERQHLVTGAFVCKNENLRGKRVLLIDDVSTSGATLNACATALKTAGAIEVRGLTVAREVLQ
ncbi:MAG: ComF family protein [Dehalococcoidia bacterium]|nr:ComF family protein [Dehalococcoidia bacterium]